MPPKVIINHGSLFTTCPSIFPLISPQNTENPENWKFLTILILQYQFGNQQALVLGVLP
jgi:hypothetical protein